MRCARTALLLAPTLAAACAGNPDRHTLAELRGVEPDVTEVQVENSLDQAMVGYRKFLEEAPKSSLTPEAMRRLADLKLEKEYGILGDGELTELPAPEATAMTADNEAGPPDRPRVTGIADHSESQADFERRTTSGDDFPGSDESLDSELPGGREASSAGPLEAIGLYDQILATYPTYEHNDQVLYQKARAFDELGRVDEAVAVIEQLITEYPHARHIDEVQFRRAEYFFTRKKYLDAEDAYSAVTEIGEGSEYYELALYKLGWTFYKQELHEEALHEYVALLDYKVSTGYDFDQSRSPPDTTSTSRRMRPTSGGLRTPSGSSASASPTSVALSPWRSISPRMGTGATRIAYTATSVSSTSRSSATTTLRSPTRRSSNSTPCTVRRPTSACGWSRSTRRADFRNWCSNRRRSSRPATGCGPSIGVTSTSMIRRRSSATCRAT
jgi:TolA-binding protein